MGHRTSRRVVATALAAAAFVLLPSVQVVHAGAAPFGTVLVRGADWAGAAAAMGDLNVYSNGSTYTGKYQCTELAMRWAAVAYSESPSWPVSSAAQMWDVGPTMPVPFEQLPNGGPVAPQFGDMIVYNVTKAFPQGHVAVVSSTGPGYVDVVEENGDWTGRATLPINGTTMPARAGSNQPVIGWLRAMAAYVPNPSGPGGQILDSWGGIHPYGSADPVGAPAYWSGWNIARDVVNQSGQPDSGYVLDGFGGVHAFGSAAPVQVTAYWPGWDIARKLVLRADGRSGYVLDGWGGIHPFGAANDMPPSLTASAFWPGWDIARALVLRSDGLSGYVLDGFGGLHSFGQPGTRVPSIPSTVYWPTWAIARGVVLASNSGGYILDGLGGVHPFGNAVPVSVTAYYAADVARGVILTGPNGGFVVFVTGALERFGNAPPPNVSRMGMPLGQAIG